MELHHSSEGMDMVTLGLRAAARSTGRAFYVDYISLVCASEHL